MPWIQITALDPREDGSPVWQLTLPWDPDTVLTIYGDSLGAALRRLAHVVQRKEQEVNDDGRRLPRPGVGQEQKGTAV